MRVFVPVASRFIRPRTNTDWRYSAKLLPLLSRYCPNLSIVTQTNGLADALINFRYALAAARSLPLLNLIPPSLTYSLGEYSPVFARDIRDRDLQAVLSYERFPSNSYGLPIAWITSPTDSERQRKEGGSATDAERLKEWKWGCAEKADKLIFTTQTNQDAFLAQSSESLRAKSVVIPFFLPGLSSTEPIAGKWQGDEWRFLFVGRQARRKGLSAALEALTPLLRDNKRLSFTIVSPLADGPIEIPSLPNIRLVPEANREEVLELMAQSHVLVMPSSWESYGFVYIEAMSRGCLPLAVDRPVQRELFEGQGLLVGSQNPEEIRSVMEEAVRNREEMHRKAQRGLCDFRSRHSPEAVAKSFYDALSELGTPLKATVRSRS